MRRFRQTFQPRSRAGIGSIVPAAGLSSGRTRRAMSPRHSNVHPLFLLAAFCGLLFCITTLTLLVLPWVETATPFTRWLEQNALPLIASEVAATLIAGGAALIFDRLDRPVAAPLSPKTPESDPHEPHAPG